MLDHRTLKRRIALSLLAFLAGCAAGEGDDERPSRRDCEAYRDRIVELRLDGVTADRAQHEANLRAALGPAFVERCLAEPVDKVRCGGKAADVESLTACAR